MKYNLKNLNIMLVVALLCIGKDIVADICVDESYCANQVCPEATKGHKKYKTYCNLNVCNNETVGGDLTVSGAVTGASFTTPEGLLFNGLRNYAVLTNQAEVTSGNNVLFAATPAGNISAGISLNDTTGAITLPSSGLFLVQYTVRLNRSPFNGSFTAIAQLQQTIAGVPTDITQAAITSNTTADGITIDEPAMQPQITGYALIHVTSAANNVLNLNMTLSPADNATLPATTGIDANAQITILQLN